MLFLTPDNDFAGEDQASPPTFHTGHTTNSSSKTEILPSSLLLSLHILSYMRMYTCWLQVISLEEIKEATSKF
jgi:hypothetical protein